MGKTEMTLAVVKDLRQLAASLESLATAIEPAEQAEVPEPVTLEQIRAVLATKSQADKREAVRNLIHKFGAIKLTDVDPAKYVEMLAEAEEL